MISVLSRKDEGKSQKEIESLREELEEARGARGEAERDRDRAELKVPSPQVVYLTPVSSVHPFAADSCVLQKPARRHKSSSCTLHLWMIQHNFRKLCFLTFRYYTSLQMERAEQRLAQERKEHERSRQMLAELQGRLPQGGSDDAGGSA